MDAVEAHKNVEVKAKVRDYDRLIAEVQALCLSHGEIIQQEDTFFNVPNGRLKLRKRAVKYTIFFLNPPTCYILLHHCNRNGMPGKV